MVTEGIIGVFATVFGALLNFLPHLTLPSWVASATSSIASMFEGAGKFSQWVPLPAIVGGIAFIFVCSAIAWSIKFGRIAVSLFTGGGGSAA